MHQTLIASAVFIALIGAAFGALFISELFPPHYRHDDTHNVVRLAANIFVVTTSLVLGLLLLLIMRRQPETLEPAMPESHVAK